MSNFVFKILKSDIIRLSDRRSKLLHTATARFLAAAHYVTGGSCVTAKIVATAMVFACIYTSGHYNTPTKVAFTE